MIKKFLKIFIILSFVILVSTEVFAYSSLTSNKPIYGTTSARINFRSSASTSSPVIRVLAKGTKVKMVGVIDSFYIVQLSTNEVGVLSKSYVTVSGISLPNALSYTRITPTNANTNTTSVNVRRGPGTDFAKVTTIANKTTGFKVIGYIGDFYTVVLSNGTIGMIKKNLVKLSTSNVTTTTTTGESKTTGDTQEETVLRLINEARVKNGLAKYTMGSKLLKIARLKSQDMVNKSYFSHTSPTYGTPFKMMQNYSIAYKSAGENIAGNPSIEDAVSSWLNSQTHRENILSKEFNYIGVGITKSPIYGNIIVAMFAQV